MGFYATYRQKIIDTGVLTPVEAKAFFEDLYYVSKKRISQEVGNEFSFYFPTKQYTGRGGFHDTANGWSRGQPLGICDHGTNTDSHRSTLKWFSSYHKWTRSTGVFGPPNASSCFVIALSGEPFLLIDFWNGKSDWHDPQFNGLTLGIEHVNCGEAKADGDQFLWWPSDFGSRYPYPETLPPQFVNFRGTAWQAPCSKAQMLTNLIIKRAFICLYYDSPEALKPRPELFLDNSTYSDTKLDLGPLWPTTDLRDFAFSLEPVKDSRFFEEASVEPEETHVCVDSLDLKILHTAAARSGKMPFNRNTEPPQKNTIHTIQEDLVKLDCVTPVNGDPTDAEYLACVKKFQTDNNLTSDGIADYATRSVILNNLVAKNKSLS